MEQRQLRKVKTLVIMLKIIFIGYFLLSAFNNRKDFINGFKGGAYHTDSSQMNQNVQNNIYEFLIVTIILIIGIVLIFLIFKLLNNLQNLKIFEKQNIFLLNKLIITIAIEGIFYNIYLGLNSYDNLNCLSKKGYTADTISINDFDVTFIVYIIIISIISIVWNYTIDLKSEHSLTV